VQQTYTALSTTEQTRREPEPNGHDRIAALHKVEDYPIIVEVTRPLAGVLQPWVQAELASAFRTLTLAVLAGALLFALRAALSRHGRSEQERRRLEHELENSQRAQAMGLLAASVAHDFNNVLAAIVGYGELAQKSVVPESIARANLDRLLSATERARLLVRRVLTFNPHRSVNYQPMAIEPVVTEVLQQIQAVLPPAVTVKTYGLELPTIIRGDATEVYQVVMNLCSNAIQAMPSGGILELRLEPIEMLETRTLALGQLSPGRWLCLMIIDNGVGIAAEQPTSIFEPFYTTRESGQGTGIGLTVVRNIVLRMKGALDVDSRVGFGTRMSVYWPLVESETALVTTTRDPNLRGGGETILVVDDDAELVILAEELLASLGYEPVGFVGSRAALDAFKRHPARFDAVITDENMHALAGCELAKRIHEIDAHMPIILITGHHDNDLDARATTAGIAAILDKPLRVETLRAALAEQLSIARSMAAS
jgi:signal transduction histidine kinase/CheY-like chemotaxis protein